MAQGKAGGGGSGVTMWVLMILGFLVILTLISVWLWKPWRVPTQTKKPQSSHVIAPNTNQRLLQREI